MPRRMSVALVSYSVLRQRKDLCNVFSYSERVLLADFSGSPATTVIFAYSPTNVSPETEVESFYNTDNTN